MRMLMYRQDAAWVHVFENNYNIIAKTSDFIYTPRNLDNTFINLERT